MKIIILGAGRLGSSVAASLVGEHNDITVVDHDADALKALKERYDLLTVTGHAPHPPVLEAAGAQDADMLIAVTGSEEINMLACQVAYILFRTPTKIAQIRSRGYLESKQSEQLFRQSAIPVDMRICSEQIITEHIQRLIDYPGAFQVLDFAGGKVQLLGVTLPCDGSFTGKNIAECKSSLPDFDFRVVMICRKDEIVAPEAGTIMETGDDVFFITARQHVHELLRLASGQKKTGHNVIISGGGEIGSSLAEKLEQNYSVKLIELSKTRANRASEQLRQTTVLHGNAVDRELLLQEGIEQADVYCALTSDDEANFFSALLAKSLHAEKVFALTNNNDYANLLREHTIDIVISPQQITIGSLLAYVRRGDVRVVHSLRRGAMESIEAIAHSGSQVVGQKIDEITLPPGTTIGAIVRDDQVNIAHGDNRIEDGDHFILLVAKKEYLRDVEKLFRVEVPFP